MYEAPHYVVFSKNPRFIPLCSKYYGENMVFRKVCRLLQNYTALSYKIILFRNNRCREKLKSKGNCFLKQREPVGPGYVDCDYVSCEVGTECVNIRLMWSSLHYPVYLK
jgi:hypothetical protein